MNAPAEITGAVPANVEAEQNLLGAILLDNAVLHKVSYLKPEHFIEPLHRDLYTAIRDMVRAGRAASPVTIRDFVDTAAKIDDDLTVAGYIAELVGGTVGAFAAEGLGLAVHDAAVKRALLGFGEGLADAVRRPGGPALTTLISDAETDLFDLAREAARTKPAQASKPAGEFGDDIAERIDADEAEALPIATGLRDLDKIVGGLRRGDLHILAGRPGMLKTGLACDLALNVASNGYPVLFFSMEMTADALASRMLTDLAYTSTLPVAYKDILDHTVTDETQRDKVRDAARRLRTLPIVIDPRRGLSAAEICLKTRRWAEYHRKKGQRPGMAVIDHLGKIRTPDRGDNRNLELGAITNAVADEAGESDVPILCLCQLSRAVESRPNKRPMLSDLRESGHIEEDARQVWGVYREAYYLTKPESDADKDIKRQDRLRDCESDLEIEVLKNSHGPTGTAKVFVHVPSGAIRDREWRQYG